MVPLLRLVFLFATAGWLRATTDSNTASRIGDRNDEFFGLRNGLMLPFASDNDLLFGSLEDPTAVAKRFVDSNRQNASKVLFFGCADEACSESSLARMVRLQQDIFWGRDDPMLLTVSHGRPRHACRPGPSSLRPGRACFEGPD